jgi:hypothetical protein
MWPAYEPLTVPAGQYLAEITSEPVEKVSQWNPSGTYLEMTMTLQDQRGEHYKFTWRFNQKMPVYKDLLELFGGKETHGRKVVLPENFRYQGKLVNITLSEEAPKNDSSRLINKVVRIEKAQPIDAGTSDKKDAFPPVIHDPAEEPEPEAGSNSEDEAPF